MSLSGELIYSGHDAYGELRVFDDGVIRTLSFGSGNEQGAVLKAQPARLLFEYTQVMLLSLLFVSPRRVLCLGLGSGSLLSALHAYLPESSLQAVELRQAVIELAEDYFYLPQSPRLSLCCEDAAEFVARSPERFDLILSDLYDDRGIASLQLQPEFLRRSENLLSPQGLLVINCWHQHQYEPSLLADLRQVFAWLRACPTADGNWILFAARQAPESRPAVLRNRAQRWSDKLGFSLTRHLKRLQEF